MNSAPIVLLVGSRPAIVLQPHGLTIAAGHTGTLTARADGYPSPLVIWEVSTNKKRWSLVSGATHTSLQVRALGKSTTRYYRAVFTNAEGTTSSRAVKVVAR